MTDLNLPMDVIQPEPPQPLITDQLEPQTPYPVATMGRILAPAVIAIVKGVKVPQCLAAQSVLGAAAMVAQGHADVLIDGRTIPLSLFCTTVSESGDRKSGADRPALHAHREWQKVMVKTYREEMKGYRDTKAAYDKAREAILKQAKEDNQAQIAAKLGQLQEPEAPPSPTIIVADPTLEGLQKAFLNGQSSMGLFNDDAGDIFGGHAMKAENQLKTVAGLSKFWDGAPINRTRAAEGESATRYGCRLSGHLMMQPVVAKEVFTNPIMQGQGFLARFLVAWPESLAGTRLYESIDLSKDPHIGRYWQRMTELLKETPKPEKGEDAPQRKNLTLDPEAKALWIAEHNRIELQLGRLGELGDIKATGAKAAEQVLRISGVLAVVGGLSCIDAPTMSSAIELGQWYLGEALRLCYPAQQDPDLVKAQKLIDWLHSKGWTEFDRNKLGKSGPSFARSSKQRDKLLATLHKARHLMSEDGKSFRINSLIVADSADFAETQQIRDFPLAEDLRMTAEDLRKSQTSAENPQASAKYPQPETRVNTELPQNPQFPQSSESENLQPDIEAI